MSGRQGIVLLRDCECGILEELESEYRFQYLKEYLARPDAEDVSLSLPLRSEPYFSAELFPFFSGLLAEGTLREIQCRKFQIDENDDFGLLLVTAGSDVIGAVSVRKAEAS